MPGGVGPRSSASLTDVIARRFQILRMLGEGGMGVVYEALDLERDERVALKRLRNVGASSLVRFKREFRSLQDLNHPNLATLYELISEGDEWYLTMELVQGDDFLAHVLPSVSSSLDATAALDDTIPAARRVGPSYPGFAVDEGRLRATLAQLARGLVALHDAGKVHRDVKPSNVLVTPAGRVVILDFGLVTETTFDPRELTATDQDVVGTPAYMAPEQATSKRVGPSADWYAVGVMLYEALTGTLPFSGEPLQVLLRKQKDEPPPPSTLAAEVPRDLDELCARLLRFDPAKRPSGRDVLRALDALAPTRGPSAVTSSVTTHPIFVGRDAELKALRDAFEAARRGGAVSVFLRGESGIGKSCLVRQFIESSALAERDLVVLAGRCYEREAVPFKAFDGVIDALSQFLARQPNGDVNQLLPLRPGPLLQVFPVLRRVEAFAAAARARAQAPLDPQELRARAFGALRELMTRLRDRRALIVVIDDMQWADGDSLALLADLLRPPDAPALLLVATVREASSETTEVSRVLSESSPVLAGDVRHLRVQRLSDGEARARAHQLLERASPDRSMSVDAIARESAGHPLFIDELVRHLVLVGAPATTLRLDDALWDRIAALEEGARRLVELVAVAGSPLQQEVASKASGASGESFTRLTSFLRVAHLVRTTGTRGADTIEPYHGRIRDAVAGRLDAETRRAYHERIALALETTGSPDHEALAIHWLEAGDAGAGVKHTVAAADHASETLAFARAAKLYERALGLRTLFTQPAGSERRQESVGEGEPFDKTVLYTKLGEALAKSGKAILAAKAYRHAARAAGSTAAIDLERRAAEQLLRGGHLDEGLALVRKVIVAVGMKVPKSAFWALVALVTWRALLRVRGLRYRPTEPSQVSALDLLRLDVMWSMASAVSLVDVVQAQLFQSQNLLMSLRVGEEYRVALAIEVTTCATGGGRAWRRTSAIMARSRELAERSRNPHAIAWSLGTAAMAHYLAGRYKAALDLGVQADEVFRNETTVNAWEMFNVQLFTLQSLAKLGKMKQLVERVQVALRDATNRGDLYAAVNLRIGHPNLVWLVRDDVVAAREQVRQAMRQWSTDGFHVEHYFEILALTNVDLYAGDAVKAHERIAARWSAMTGSLVTRVQAVRIYAWQLRARAALAVAASDPARRSELATLAVRDARRMKRERMPWGSALAALIVAGAQRVQGDAAAAIDTLGRAAHELERADMKLYAMAARYAMGTLQGASGRAGRASAEAWMREEAIQAPARMARALATGCVE